MEPLAGPVFAAFSLAPWKRPLLGLGIALGVVAVLSWTPALAPGAERPLPLPLAGRRIVLDPGHGGIDPGCHRDGILEKDLTLRVALLLAARLTERGAEVTLTRESDTELSHLTQSEPTRHSRDLAARVLIAEESGAEILVSLHVNAASSAQLGGAIVFHHQGSEEGRRLAQAIFERLEPVVPGNQSGVLPHNFYILRRASMPAVLVELGFLTHARDREKLMSDEGRARMAEAIAAGIEAYALRAARLPDQAAGAGQEDPSASSAAGEPAGHMCAA